MVYIIMVLISNYAFLHLMEHRTCTGAAMDLLPSFEQPVDLLADPLGRGGASNLPWRGNGFIAIS